MKAVDGYVIAFSEQTVVQMILHIITILALVAGMVVTVYVLFLLIKLMRRAITALDIWKSKKE